MQNQINLKIISHSNYELKIKIGQKSKKNFFGSNNTKYGNF